MPSKSLAQDRFVRAKAAEGVGWAKTWIADEAGTKIPHVERLRPFTSKPKASDVQHVRKIKRRRKRVKRG